MSRVTVFADESGNLDFRPHAEADGISRYFILSTITCTDYEVGSDLLALRRALAWNGVGLDTEFHATTDLQEIRDEVFNVIQEHDFRIDATVFEKSKAQPQTRHSDDRFYQYAWFYHMKYVAPRVVSDGDQLLVIGASFGTKKKRSTFRAAIQDVMQQVAPRIDHEVASWDSRSDPCLQVADYCCWAIGRKWERSDTRSYDLISDKIQTEFEIWREGKTHYY